jgi:hypothetical protein
VAAIEDVAMESAAEVVGVVEVVEMVPPLRPTNMMELLPLNDREG